MMPSNSNNITNNQTNDNTNFFNRVNHLVLNFYPDGYSIAVKLNEFPVFTSETILETAKISYEETSLLDYIENEELPPLLVEMIDGSPKLSQYKIWHNGCLILEIRDKINNNSNNINTNISTDSNTSNNNNNNNNHENAHFVLLKPTNLSMLNDVLKLTESSSWSTQDRLQLESQIVLHNAPPLFLEPDAGKHPDDQHEDQSRKQPQDNSQQQQRMELSPSKPGSEDDEKHSSPQTSSASIISLSSTPSSSNDNQNSTNNDGKWNCLNINNIYTKHKRKFPHSDLIHKNKIIRNSYNNYPYTKSELTYNNHYKSDSIETNDNRCSSRSNCSTANNNGHHDQHHHNYQTYNSIKHDHQQQLQQQHDHHHYQQLQQQSEPSPSTVNLPPELILQQFLATRRAKKRSFPIESLARFHRHKKDC